MDIYDILKGSKVIPNPNKTSKKDGLPATVQVPYTEENTTTLDDIFLNNAPSKGMYYGDLDLKELSEYGITPTAKNVDRLDYELAEKQGTFEKVRHGFTQAVVNEVALGIFKVSADLSDITIGTAIRSITGEENDYHNAVSDFIEGLQNSFEKMQPIYKTPGVDITNGGLHDDGWWASNIPSIFISLSMLFPSQWATKGVITLGKLAKIGKGTASARRFITQYDKVAKAVEEGKELGSLGKASQWANNYNTIQKAKAMGESALTATFSRLSENYQEGHQVFDEIFNDAYNGATGFKGLKDLNKEEYADFINHHAEELEGVDTNDKVAVAKRLAKLAADKTFKEDLVNGIFDFYQVLGLRNLYKVSSKKLTGSLKRKHKDSIKYFSGDNSVKDNVEEKFIKKAGRKIKDKYFDGSRVVLGELSEGVEEAINYIAQEEGLHYGHVLMGTEKESAFDDRLTRYFKSPELYESAFWGVAGGVAFHILGSAYNKSMNARAKKKEDKKWKEEHKDSDKTGEEKPNKTFWDYWEDEETRARTADIENRTLKYEQLKTSLSQIEDKINPFEKNEDGTNKILKTKEEQDNLREEVVRNYTTDLLLNSMFNGNFDSTIAFLQDDAVIKAFVDNGLITKEEAERRKQEVATIAAELEESFSRNLYTVGNAFAGKDEATGADFSEVPSEYLQIIAKENVLAELAIKDIDRKIGTLDAANALEEKRVEEELKKSGIDYKSLVEAYALQVHLNEVNAELDRINSNTSKDSDPRTLSGQIAKRRLNNFKEVLTNQLREKNYVLTQNSLINDLIGDIGSAVSLLQHKIKSNDEQIENNDEWKKFNSAVNSIIKNVDTEKLEDDTVSALAMLQDYVPSIKGKAFADVNTTFKKSREIDALINKALNKKSESYLGNISDVLLQNYAKRTTLEVNKAFSLKGIVRDKRSVRDRLYELHNEQSIVRNAAITMGFNTIKGIAAKYDNVPGLDRALAYGRLDTASRDKLKNTLTEEEFREYDDAMDILALNKQSITKDRTKKNTRAENSLIPELIEKALWSSRKYGFIEDTQPPVEESEQTTSATEGSNESETIEEVLKPETTPKAQISDTKISESINQSSEENNANRSEENSLIKHYSTTNQGAALTAPLGVLQYNNDKAPIKVVRCDSNQMGDALILVPVEDEGDNVFELRLQKDARYDADYEGNPNIFNIKNSDGDIVRNPKVELNDDGTIENFIPGVIDVVEESNKQTSSTGGLETPEDSIKAEYKNSKNVLADGSVNPSAFDEYKAQEVPSYAKITGETAKFALNYIKTTDSPTIDGLRKAMLEHFSYLNNDSDVEAAFNLQIRSYKRFIDAKNKKNNEQKTDDDKARDAIMEIGSASYVYDVSSDEAAKMVAVNVEENAFEDLLKVYLNYAITEKDNDGKLIISLENLLRYVNSIARDEQIAEQLYDSFIAQLSSSNKYTLLEVDATDKRKSAAARRRIIANSLMSSQQRMFDSDMYDDSTINVKDIFERLSESDQEKARKVIDELMPNDLIEYESDGKDVYFKKDGVVFGFATRPTVTRNKYTMQNMGWIVDIPKNGIGAGKLETFFINAMVNPNEYEDYEKLKQLINKLATVHKTDKNGKITKQYEDLANDVFKALKSIKEASEVLVPNDFKNKDFKIIDYMLSVYKGVRNISTQYLTKQKLTIGEAYNKQNDIRVKSIHNFFEKRRKSYATTLFLADNPNLKIKVNTAREGNLNIISPKEARPVNEDGVIGSDHKNSIVVATRNRSGDIVHAKGDYSVGAEYITAGSTFIAIPRKSGKFEYVHAYPRTIGSFKGKDKSNAVVRSITSDLKEAIKEKFTYWTTNWKKDSNVSAKDIADVFFYYFGKGENQEALLQNVFITSMTGDYKGYNIVFKTPDGKFHYLNLFDAHPDGSRGAIIKFDDENAHAGGAMYDEEKEIRWRDKYLEIINNLIDECASFNIGYKYVEGDTSLKEGAGRLREDGKFVVKHLLGNSELVFDSFNDFIINNGLVNVTTKSEDGKTNFVKNTNQWNNERVTFKVVAEYVPDAEVERKLSKADKLTPEGAISVLTSNDPEKLRTLTTKLLSESDLKELLKTNFFERVLHGSVEYVPTEKIGGKEAIAAYYPSSDKIVLTDKWMALLESGKHDEAFRHIVHEATHRQIAKLTDEQRKDLFDDLRSVFNKFVEQNRKDNLSDVFSFYEYNNDRNADGSINDNGLEEFLVESMTRPMLMKRLNSISEYDTRKVSDSKYTVVQKDNLFQRIMKIIAKLFGIDINKGSLLAKEYRIFNNIFNNPDLRLEETKPTPKVEPKKEPNVKQEPTSNDDDWDDAEKYSFNYDSNSDFPTRNQQTAGVNNFNVDNVDTSKVDVEFHEKPWKNDNTKINRTLRLYLKDQHEKGYFELVKDQEFGQFSVHFKTGNADTQEIYGSTKEERKILFEELVKAVPDGAVVSTWGNISEAGLRGLNNVGRDMTKIGERTIKDRQGNNVVIPIYQKGENDNIRYSTQLDNYIQPIVSEDEVSDLLEPNNRKKFIKMIKNSFIQSYC